MKPTVITGKVRISEDDDGRLLSVSLKAEDGPVYKVVLDAQGELLGLDMAGFRAEVHGSVLEKGGRTWLQVVSFDEAAPSSTAGVPDASEDDSSSERDAAEPERPPDARGDDDLADDDEDDKDDANDDYSVDDDEEW